MKGEEKFEGADTTTDGTNILAMHIDQSVKRRDGKQCTMENIEGKSPLEKKKGRKVDPLRVLKKRWIARREGHESGC